MRRLSWVLAMVLSSGALAQSVQIDLSLPSIVFPAPPPLVVVTPGVQVVPDYDEEVFFVDGWYWCRRGPRWFRTRSHGGGWLVVDAPLVPPVLVKVPPGKYRRFRPGKVHAVHPVHAAPGGRHGDHHGGPPVHPGGKGKGGAKAGKHKH